MANTGLDPIRRAAGMIAWKLDRRKPRSQERYTLSEAVAQALEAEPQMTEAQIAYARDWALASHALTQLLNSLPEGKTLQQLMDESGVSYYADPANYPPDEQE